MPSTCPSCGSTLDGGGWNRTVSVSIPSVMAGVLYYSCPTCSHKFHAHPMGTEAHRLAAMFIGDQATTYVPDTPKLR